MRSLKSLPASNPVGCSVRLWLMHGQVNPSLGEIIAHEGGRLRLFASPLEQPNGRRKERPGRQSYFGVAEVMRRALEGM